MRRVAPITALLVSLYALGCSSSEKASIDLAAPGAACSKTEKCGQNCTSDDDCGAGAYCNLGGTCSADCADGLACPAGSTCDAHGQCSAATEALDGSVPDAPFSDACPNVTVTFDKTIPTVVVLVDQSLSMNENFGGSSRWNTARRALVDSTNGVVKVLEKEVRFGLTLFSAKTSSSGGGTCPQLTSVPIALNNYDAINKMYQGASPLGETPTGESLAAVATSLADPSIPGPKYIVLATDGEPDTCAVPNPSGAAADAARALAVKAASDAFKNGIQTFYISVGTSVTAAHAQDMANAGQGAAAGAKTKYYVATDATSLKSAFDTIIGGVRSCAFKLNGKVVDPTKGTVTLDGATLGYGDANGWTLSSDGTEVTLQGTACTKIKTGDHTINANFACGAVIK